MKYYEMKLPDTNTIKMGMKKGFESMNKSLAFCCENMRLLAKALHESEDK